MYPGVLITAGVHSVPPLPATSSRAGPPIDSAVRESVGPQKCRDAYVRISVKGSIGERVLVSKEHHLVQGEPKEQGQPVLGGQLEIRQGQALPGSRGR